MRQLLTKHVLGTAGPSLYCNNPSLLWEHSTCPVLMGACTEGTM